MLREDFGGKKYIPMSQENDPPLFIGLYRGISTSQVRKQITSLAKITLCVGNNTDFLL